MGHNRQFHNQFLPFFPVLNCPLGLGELQACPFPDVVFPPLLLSALSSFPLSLCLARWFWPDLMNGRHDHTTAVCVSLRWSGSLRVVQLPAGSCHGLFRKWSLCEMHFFTMGNKHSVNAYTAMTRERRSCGCCSLTQKGDPTFMQGINKVLRQLSPPFQIKMNRIIVSGSCSTTIQTM